MNSDQNVLTTPDVQERYIRLMEQHGVPREFWDQTDWRAMAERLATALRQASEVIWGEFSACPPEIDQALEAWEKVDRSSGSSQRGDQGGTSGRLDARPDQRGDGTDTRQDQPDSESVMCEVRVMEDNTDRKHRVPAYYRDAMRSCERERCPCRARLNLIVREGTW